MLKQVNLSMGNIWKQAALVIMGTISVSGCSDRVALASNKMVEIRASQSGSIEPLPEYEVVDDYIYDAYNLRSPFIPPSLSNQKRVDFKIQDIVPDLKRVKGILEQYELSQLIYRGKVVAATGVQYGLIQRPDGIVESVKIGSYAGTHQGRIVEITSSQINLIETIADDNAGYIEKANSIVSPF